MLKGSPQLTVEEIGQETDDQGYLSLSCHMAMPDTDAIFYLVVTNLPNKNGKHSTWQLGARYEVGAPVLDMSGMVSSWREGGSLQLDETFIAFKYYSTLSFRLS